MTNEYISDNPFYFRDDSSIWCDVYLTDKGTGELRKIPFKVSTGSDMVVIPRDILYSLGYSYIDILKNGKSPKDISLLFKGVITQMTLPQLNVGNHVFEDVEVLVTQANSTILGLNVLSAFDLQIYSADKKISSKFRGIIMTQEFIPSTPVKLDEIDVMVYKDKESNEVIHLKSRDEFYVKFEGCRDYSRIMLDLVRVQPMGRELKWIIKFHDIDRHAWYSRILSTISHLSKDEPKDNRSIYEVISFGHKNPDTNKGKILKIFAKIDGKDTVILNNTL